MKLVIIESPGKTEALKKYLGDDYVVMPSKGHVRDLPLKTLGVDMINNFEPNYQILPDKKDVIANLKKQASKAEVVYLATDPDREGEAISWHIAYALGIPLDTECRVVFNEISKNAVQEAMKHPRKIDLNLVNAQQTRRILDRIVGYKLSPIICKKIQSNLSAGRVQSVALKLIVDREKEILDFVPEEYWNVWSNAKKDNDKLVFKLNLNTFKGKKIKISSKEECDKVLDELKQNNLIVKSIKKTKTKTHAPAPFTTATMQQDAQNKLSMSLKKTSACAQQLYEGVEIAGEGKIALVTYIRTDSTRVSTQAQESALKLIEQKFGKQYVPSKPNIYTTKKNAQDAHEAIRPISLERTPESLKGVISQDNYKLYKLIYERFVASQMSEAIYNNVVVSAENGDYGFKATGKTLEFAGFTAVYKNVEELEEKSSVLKIPVLEENDILDVVETKSEQKFTKPPARYTESTIVDAMEEK
ncbi:MAG: type I DNA topoisomerase, partial [Clostridia bacterium]|nr:type I DNA topoisomerase [Clostridia bacterium]